MQSVCLVSVFCGVRAVCNRNSICLRYVGTFHQTTRHRIARDRNLNKIFHENKRFVFFNSVWEKLISILGQYLGYRAEKFSLLSLGAHVIRRNTPRNFPSRSLPTSSMLGFTLREKFSHILLYMCMYQHNVLTLCIFSGYMGMGMKYQCCHQKVSEK